jgi:metallo-beta-lactamase family protein
MEKNKLKFTFYDGIQTIPGANFLLEVEKTKILIDVGLLPVCLGCDSNSVGFAYNPAEIDLLFVTHSHLSRIGRIPKLIKEGFKGKIYSTPATKDLATLLFSEKKSDFYDSSDVDKMLSLWETKEYGNKLELNNNLSIIFRDAGHILGSAMIEVSTNDKKIVFTGSLGNSPHPLLKDIEKISNIDYLIIESVYGNKEHEDKNRRRDKLEDVIENTINREGILIIPTSSLERTQDILYEIYQLIEKGKIPQIPVIVDSALSIKILEIYKKYTENLNEKVRESLKKGRNIFDFPLLKFVTTKEESDKIHTNDDPKIIVGGVGDETNKKCYLSERCLSNPNNSILFTEHQLAGSVGRQLQEGVDFIEIQGKKVSIKAQVETISGYSSHADSKMLFSFVENLKESLKEVFVVTGEPKSSLYFIQRIRDYLGINAKSPEKGKVYEIEI